MTSYPSYREAQLAARAAAGSLSESAVAAIRAELTREANRLAAQLASLPVGSPTAQRAALEASAKLVAQMDAQLTRASVAAIAKHRAVGFAEVAGIWQRAAIETGKLQGIPNALMGAVRQPPITLLGSYEALGGAAAHWKTALQGAVQASGADLNAIIRHGLSAQVSPEEIARGLRAYVVGAEPFHQAFAGEAFQRVQDLRTGVPVHLREAGRKLAFNARRIAYSEVHNARAEAEVTHFAIDPLVESIQWVLSVYRGEVVVPDVCDLLATANWYGLGPGRYPIGKVPPPPHPFDRCERMPVTRSAALAGAAKPFPLRALPPAQVHLPAKYRSTTTAAQAARVRAQAEKVMAAAEQWSAANPLQTVIDVGLSGGAKIVARIAAHQAALQKTLASAAVAPAPLPVAAPQLVAVGPPPAVTLGKFIVPGELAAQPGVLDEVKVLIKKHRNKSKTALGQLEAMGVDVSAAKAAQAAIAAKKAAAAQAKLAGEIGEELAALEALGIRIDVPKSAYSELAVMELKVAKTAAVTSIEKGFDVAASAANMIRGAYPTASVDAFLERAFAAAVKSIDLTDGAAVAKLQQQAPSPRAGMKLAAAVKKAKASAASKLAAQTKATKAAEALAAKHGVQFPAGTALVTIRKAEKVMDALVAQIEVLAEAGHTKTIALARAQARKKLRALGVTSESLEALKTKWAASPLGNLTPSPAVTAATNAPVAWDPAVVLGQQIGPQAGTNAGGLYLGTDGVKRYVKFYAQPAQAHSEALANALYRDLGLAAPKSGVGVTAQGQTFFASELLDVAGTVGAKGLAKAQASEILDGFAADVLLANWDAVGTGFDNVVVLAGGGIARIDQGGALLFRAQGGLKTATQGYGAAGLKQIPEFETLYTKNAYYRKVFTTAEATPETLGTQLAEAVARITQRETAAGGWQAYVDQLAPGLAATERTQIADMLTARSALLRQKVEALVPSGPPTPSAAALEAFAKAPYQVTETTAAQLTAQWPGATTGYFQSGKSTLSALQQGIDVTVGPGEFGVQGFSVTAGVGPKKHHSAIVSKYLIAPQAPVIVDVAGLTTPKAVQQAVTEAIAGVLGKSPATLSPADVRAALVAKGRDAIVLQDATGVQQVLLLDAKAAKFVKPTSTPGFTAKAVPWAPEDPQVLAAQKAAAEAAERERLASLPVDPAELEVPGLPSPPSKVIGRGKSSLGLDEAPDVGHLLSDRERRMIGLADEELDKQTGFAALGGTRAKVREAFERAASHSDYKANVEQQALHTLVTDLGKAIAKREGLTAAQYTKAEKAIVGFIREWSTSSDSRGAEVLKLMAERLRPGNLRTAKAGNGFFDHQDSSYRAFVRSARQYLETSLAGSGVSVEQFTAAYDAYVAAQRAVMRAAYPTGRIRVTRGVRPETFFSNQGVSRDQFGSSVVVSHNSLSSFSTGPGFPGVKFVADVPIDDVEYHYLLIRRTQYWGEREVWLLGRPRRMQLLNH